MNAGSEDRTSRPLCVYHANCLDGFTAAWAVRCVLGDKADYFPASYAAAGADVELPDVTGRDVLIVDFCTGREQLLQVKQQAKSLLVFDHHKTAEAACAGLAFCTFDMEQSGAGLVWRKFVEPHPEYMSLGMPWVVAYVEDRDLWRFALPHSKAVNAFLSSQPMAFDAWDRLETLEIDHAIYAGSAVVSYVDRYVAEMSLQARHKRFAGFDGVPIVNAPYINASELIGHLAEGKPFAVGWFQRVDGMYQYSLRSRGDFDVSAVAKLFDGGGHKNAAGFTSALMPHELRETPGR